MLELKNINKDYVVTSELTVHALKNVSFKFRNNEFVSVLGPSGCGKTTLLNIIGGLDRYTSGDLVIDGVSTKGFKDSDWDDYRNRSVGFVFQSYNLIPHVSVLENVMLSLTFAGVGKAERRARAKEALARVGLAAQMNKRPNQLSGGQMQRVAIARAIVGNPQIILADEPTGALDAETGVQVMELLKEIARDRLVILVTHNEQLAEEYSTRIVRLSDGKTVDDSNPFNETAAVALESEKSVFVVQNEKQPDEKTSRKPRKHGKLRRIWASVVVAFGISFHNLRGKIGRTLLTVFAGSIGIFGIALVMAISGGMDNYVGYIQTEAVGSSAVTVGETAYNVSQILSVVEEETGGKNEAYPDMDGVLPYQRQSFSVKTTLSDGFLRYVNEIDSSWVQTIDYSYGLNLNVLRLTDTGVYTKVSWSSYARQMVSKLELVENNYNVLAHSENSNGFPKDMHEVVLVVDKFNRINPNLLSAIGVTVGKDEKGNYKKVLFSDIVGKELEIVLNDGWYKQQSNGNFKAISSPNDYAQIDESNKVRVKIVGVLRNKSNDATQWLNVGLAYLSELSEFLVQNASESAVGKAQIENKETNVLTGKKFTLPEYGTQKESEEYLNSQYVSALKTLGAYRIPTSVHIYPKDIDSKEKISGYIDNWNVNHPDEEVSYLDLTGLALSVLGTFIKVVSWVLIAFSAVALVVSTVMISVITYTSVVERTKEIGVLRSIGATKEDVSAIFNVETAIIGTLAGLLGVVSALIMGSIANAILSQMLGIGGIVSFTVWIVLGMFALSVLLTVLAGLIPARIAAKKDPVKCLRTE